MKKELQAFGHCERVLPAPGKSQNLRRKRRAGGLQVARRPPSAEGWHSYDAAHECWSVGVRGKGCRWRPRGHPGMAPSPAKGIRCIVDVENLLSA
jgi:hypothetical protein